MEIGIPKTVFDLQASAIAASGNQYFTSGAMLMGNPVSSWFDRPFPAFLRYAVGGLMLLVGAGMLVGSVPIYIKPFGLCLAVAGTLLLPPIGRMLGDRSRKFAPWHILPLVSAGTLLAGFVLTVVASAAWDSAHPELAAKRDAQHKAEQQAALARDAQAKAEKLRQRQLASNEARSDLQGAMTAMWGQVTSYMDPCEKSQHQLGVLLNQSGAAVQSYQMAEQGQQVCFQARNGLQQISPPTGLSEKSTKLATDGLADCSSALLGRMTFLNIAGKVIDGDRRPSRLAEAQAQSQAADALTLQCVAKLTEAAMTDGLKLEKR